MSSQGVVVWDRAAWGANATILAICVWFSLGCLCSRYNLKTSTWYKKLLYVSLTTIPSNSFEHYHTFTICAVNFIRAVNTRQNTITKGISQYLLAWPVTATVFPMISYRKLCVNMLKYRGSNTHKNSPLIFTVFSGENVLRLWILHSGKIWISLVKR